MEGRGWGGRGEGMRGGGGVLEEKGGRVQGRGRDEGGKGG